MSKSHQRSSSQGVLDEYHSYPCRICKSPHPLRTCRKFLGMNISDRIHVVRKHKYCSNCLAHNHSWGTCFSKYGCKYCHKFHHTLLHAHPRLLKDIVASTRSRSRSLSPPPTPLKSPEARSLHKSKRTSSPPSASNKPSLSSILYQDRVILLPTALVKVGSSMAHARCLLDSGSPVSRVSKKLIDKLGLTAYGLQDEAFCPLVLRSRFDSSSRIEGTFRVDNQIAVRTPEHSLAESYKKNFRDLFLADSNFYESAPIDIVIGVDLYPKLLCPGVFSRVGLPTAQSTLFGWVIYGICTP